MDVEMNARKLHRAMRAHRGWRAVHGALWRRIHTDARLYPDAPIRFGVPCYPDGTGDEVRIEVTADGATATWKGVVLADHEGWCDGAPPAPPARHRKLKLAHEKRTEKVLVSFTPAELGALERACREGEGPATAAHRILVAALSLSSERPRV